MFHLSPPVTMLFAPLAVAGCAGTQSPAPSPASPPVPVSPASGAQPADPVLGVVDGAPVRRSDLGADAVKKLRDMENEHLQRRMHLMWTGLESVIDERLLAREAEHRGISVADLRASEVAAKVTEPTDAELRAFYDRYEDRIGVEFEHAAPHIKRQLYEQRLAEQEQAFLAELRESVDVRYSLPAPDLPRYRVGTGNAPVLGPDSAKVTLIEFSDFQCPYCGQARHVVKALTALYPDSLRVAYRYFPLSQHPQAQPAAEAAECAHEQGEFWPYHDRLFDHPDALRSEDLERYAGEIGLDVEDFHSCLASERPRRAITSDEEVAKLVGVEGTPALFLNGIKLIGLLPLPLMRALIDHELAAR